MRKHAHSDQKLVDSIKNMKFAKEFFKILDINGTEKVDLEEFAVPLIALGLSSDISFVEKVIRSINPSKYEGIDFTDELHLKEFTKIFRRDTVGEYLTSYIQDLILERKRAQRKKQQRVAEDR